jgi:hypothetical protein
MPDIKWHVLVGQGKKLHAPRAACLFAAYGELEGNVNHGGFTCLFEEITFWPYYSSLLVNKKLELYRLL